MTTKMFNLSALALSVLSIPARTDRPVPTDPKELKYAKEAGHWRCKLTLNGRSFEFEMSMGAAHRRWVSARSKALMARQTYHLTVLRQAGYKFEPGKPAQRKMFGESMAAAEAFQAATEPTPPELLDVLRILQWDVRDVSNGETFEDWASNWGEEHKDSIKALKMFKACKKTADALLRLFGREAFDEFLAFDFDAEMERVRTESKPASFLDKTIGPDEAAKVRQHQAEMLGGNLDVKG